MMNKFLSIVLVFVLLIASISCLNLKIEYDNEYISKEEAYQFADELKAIDGDVENRLIVQSNKKIDFQSASQVATGIDGLYVLQYDSKKDAENAYNYYSGLSYIKSVEYDANCENIICEDNSANDDNLERIDSSTAYCHIDDAYKLIKKHNSTLPTIKVGIIDSGVYRTSATTSRLDGGYSYINGYAADGTDDLRFHGTMVAGTIILNTFDNVRLYSYQILDKNGSGNVSTAISATYQAIADGCKVINCSFCMETGSSVNSAYQSALDYAMLNRVFVIVGAGNNSADMLTLKIMPQRLKNIITVGATGADYQLASFTNYGEGVDVYAPGVYLKSYDKNGILQKDFFNGTSAATPVISSVVAALLCTGKSFTIDEMKYLLSYHGYATLDETYSTSVIADAYEIVKDIYDDELEKTDISYELTENTETGLYDLTLHSNDKDAEIFYYQGIGGVRLPYADLRAGNNQQYKYVDTLSYTQNMVMMACAYSPNKERSEVLIIPLPSNTEAVYEIVTKTGVLYCNNYSDKVITLPESIGGTTLDTLNKFAFAGHQNVETVILPKSITKIEKYAFASCHNLKTVIAPGVTECDRMAFYNCHNLETFDAPNLKRVGAAAFKGCENLKEINCNNLTTICNEAFSGCESLMEVNSTVNNATWAICTFKECNSLICKASGHNYKCSSVLGNTIIYKCTDCGFETTRDADYVFNEWNSSIINKHPKTDLFSSDIQIDVVPDGIFNGKDYARLRYAKK